MSEREPPWSESGTKQLPVDKNGRLVIPKEWREALELEPGMHLHAYLDKHRIVLTDGTEFIEHFRAKAQKAGGTKKRKTKRGPAKKR
jgi:AbrB family looped-hinge helix DNA binding protein